MSENSIMTFNVVNQNGQYLHKRSVIVTENIKNNNFINSIITVMNDNSISEADEKKLVEIAGRKTGSDKGVIEDKDMTPEEKLALAKKNSDYTKHYNLSLSPDKKYLVVEIKSTGMLYPDPHLSTIKSDFGFGEGVLVTKDGIPHGNKKTIESRINITDYDTNNLDYDSIELQAGDKLNIPIDAVIVQPGTQGFWSRPWF